MNTKATLLALGGILATHAHGAVTVVNGDFSTGSPTGFTFGIPNWGETNENTNSFLDFLVSGATALDGGTSAGVNTTGYIYQEIGSKDFVTETSLLISGVNYWRNNTGGQRDSLSVQLFSLPSTDPFVFQESGNDIAGAAGVNQVFAAVVPAPTAQNSTVVFDLQADVSGVAVGDRLFLRFSDGDPVGGSIAYVDNVSATLVAIPEPSTFGLAGLGLLGFLRRRR